MNITLLLIRFPYISTLLWKGSVFHGFEALYRLSATSNCCPADCSDALLWLQSQGYIIPKQFRPTHSQAAFMGLEKGVHKRDAVNPPNAGNASAFDWECIKEARFRNEILL